MENETTRLELDPGFFGKSKTSTRGYEDGKETNELLGVEGGRHWQVHRRVVEGQYEALRAAEAG